MFITPVSRMVVSCHAIAIACTIARLLYRLYTRRFWWEDACAMIAAAWAVICATGFLLYDPSMSYTSRHNQTSAWLLALSFTGVLWAVRLSIFLSLVRVSNPTGLLRHIALACIASIVIMFTASMAQKIYYCTADQCYIAMTVGVLQLITDILADTFLLLGPVLLLRDVHLSKNRRILILSAFSSSILITAISITHSVLLIEDVNLLTTILAEMKAALSLFVCNILVLVTFAYRVCRCRGKRGGVDLDASYSRAGPLYLTTIDLGQLTVVTVALTDTVGSLSGESGAGVDGDGDGGRDAESGQGRDSMHVHGALPLSSSSAGPCPDAGSADKDDVERVCVGRADRCDVDAP